MKHPPNCSHLVSGAYLGLDGVREVSLHFVCVCVCEMNGCLSGVLNHMDTQRPEAFTPQALITYLAGRAAYK